VQIIDVSRIISVVAMVPHKLEKHRAEEQHYFLVERPGLDVVRLGGSEENLSY
jgi:hypothetical protein